MNKLTNGNTPPLPSQADKNKEWQLELLMEKLRSKSSQFKSLPEISKSVRMTMLDKRFSLDSVEKIQHQKCLDTLQHCIKVTSLQSMVERLESLTRQLGLKFMVGISGVDLFISSDMFYLEINLEQSGAVRDVKVHHEGKVEQQSCAELVSCLSRQDFADFTAQLEGFASIYQLNAEKKIKCKAFTALQSLESDLYTLAQLQTFMKEPFNLLHKSPVGILEKRRGGHPMKLTYFVSPYDLIDKEKGDLEPITVEAVTSRNLGYSVTVCMEGSAAHKLQTVTLITIRNNNGKSTPSFAPLTNHNSAVIPACFVLRLNKPMPMCFSLVKQIQELTELECTDTSATHPLISLIVTHVSEGKLDCRNNKGLFVTLPDQHHCYFMTENKSMEGVMINSVPFTHPGHVSQILVILRQQALFNTLIASCVRSNNKQDFESMIMFEISALSWTHISVSVEHPIEETMATAELDLTDISNLKCHVPNSESPLPQDVLDPTSEFGTKVLNRCISIPVTMRSIIKIWDKQATRNAHYNRGENFNLPLGSGDPGGHKGGSSGSGSGLGDFGGGMDGKGKTDPGVHHNLAPLMSSSSHSHPGMFLNDSVLATAANFSNFPASGGGEAPMISNMELANILSGHAEKTASAGGSGKHLQKRRTSEDLWKSMKQQRKGEDSEIMLETSSNDSTSRSTPSSSHEAPSEISITTPTSMVGFQSDLELSALDPTELIGTPTDKALPEFENIDDELGDVEEMLAVANNKIRKRELHKSPSGPSIIDLGDKGLVPPSVSITPINPPPGFSSSGSSISVERRPGIEIIPIATTPPTSIPSSITITPLSSSQMKSIEDRSREKKSGSKSRSDDKNRPEKKRKRKRDESPMGPPEKIPSSSKQDPLSKPVSVSIIKPSESPPMSSGPSSPSSLMRKFNASPTPTKSFSVSGKLSPSLTVKGSLKASGSSSSSSSLASPKHSPAHVASSPKHGLISSPKNHGTSPKHPSASGSSGKPSLSTLKSAASSPSSKSSGTTGSDGGSVKIKSSSKEGSRDKSEKRSSSSSSSSFGANSNKVKSSVKLKQLDLSGGGSASYNSGPSSDLQVNQIDNLPSPTATSGSDFSKCSNPAQIRNRKGSLSAVIDKLKSAQHCDGATDLSSKSSSSNRDRSGQTGASGKSTEGGKSGTSGGSSGSSGSGKTSSGETKNSEYMVKPSLDGMKITINKTRTKDSSKSLLKSQSGGSSGTGSPKTHTGLKPGVNSGPASKKPQQLGQQKSSSSGLNLGASAGASAVSAGLSSFSNFKPNKNLASKGLSKSSATKFGNSPKSSAADLSGRSKDKPRFNKGSDKSVFGGSRDRKASPTQNRDDIDGSDKAALKMAFSKLDPYATPPIMGEVLIKQLDKKFQIPKLSARNAEDKKNVTPNNKLPSSEGAVNSLSGRAMESTGSKMYCNDVSLPKYPLPLPTTKMFDSNLESKIRMSMIGGGNPVSGSSSSPKHNEYGSTDSLDDRKKDIPQNLTTGNALLMGKDDAYKQHTNYGQVNSSMGAPGKSAAYPIASDLSVKSVDLSVNKFAVPSSDKKDLAKMYGKDLGGDGLLDYSSSSKGDKSAVNSAIKDVCGGGGMTSGSGSSYPPSSSVSVHIVKSPDPSPHSASPCITDDELMDEALIGGLGK